MFICNFTPVDRPDYCVGVPVEGSYKRILTNYSYINENDNLEAAEYKKELYWQNEEDSKYTAVEGECDRLPYRLNIHLRPFESMIIRLP